MRFVPPSYLARDYFKAFALGVDTGLGDRPATRYALKLQLWVHFVGRMR